MPFTHAQILTLARACAAKVDTSLVGRSVSLFPHSLTVAAVDTKRGYVGMCNGRSAQQESAWSGVVQEQHRGLNYIQVIP